MSRITNIVRGANASIQRVINVGPGKNLWSSAQVGNVGLRGSGDISGEVAVDCSGRFFARTADGSGPAHGIVSVTGDASEIVGDTGAFAIGSVGSRGGAFAITNRRLRRDIEE